MAFPTTSVLDDFNRADGSVGANWTLLDWISQGTTVVLTISSSQVAFSASGADGNWNPVTFGPDSEVFITVPAISVSIELYVRMANPGSTPNCYRARFRNASNSFFLYRADAGVSTQLGASVAGALANGDTAGVDIVGSNVSMYQKTGGSWTTIMTRSDSTYTAAGYIGLYGNGSADRGDDFGGGTIPGGAPVVTASPSQAFM